MPSLRIAVPLGICALSALSLLAPFEPLHDAWAWLVWGREVTGLELDTTAGPSWKPLPVIVTAVLSPAGDAAPRCGCSSPGPRGWRRWRSPGSWRARLSIPRRRSPGSRRIRVRLARVGAGLLAAIGIVLLSDPFTSWTRQFSGGLSEPLLVALVLGAVDRGLADRHGQALALGFAASLLRPEAWPLFGAYLVWTWRRRPELRRWNVAMAIALPALWLVPDLLASGDALTGADRARGDTGSPLPEALEALGRAFELPLAALWVGAAACVAGAWRDGERQILVLAGGAAAWLAIVAALAAFGYAGLPRFSAPAAAIVCVLGAAGLVRWPWRPPPAPKAEAVRARADGRGDRRDRGAGGGQSGRDPRRARSRPRPGDGGRRPRRRRCAGHRRPRRRLPTDLDHRLPFRAPVGLGPGASDVGDRGAGRDAADRGLCLHRRRGHAGGDRPRGGTDAGVPQRRVDRLRGLLCH